MFRTVAATSSRTLRAVRARQFSISATRNEGPYPGNLSTNSKTKTDKYPDDKHAVDKVKEGDTHNVQEANAKAGMDSAKKSGSGGNATEARDSAGGAAKQKKEFPEAPDAIGMQDERGGRGG